MARRRDDTRAAVLAYLFEHGGSIEDPQGRAATLVRDALGLDDAAKQILGDMERSGLIRRTIRGRRTFVVELGPNSADFTPARGVDAPRALAPDTPRPTSGPAESEVDESGAGEHINWDALASAMLSQVLARLSQTSATADLRSSVDELRAELVALGERISKIEHNLDTPDRTGASRLSLSAAEQDILAVLTSGLRPPAGGNP